VERVEFSSCVEIFYTFSRPQEVWLLYASLGVLE
jgi:hypothetical protein